MHTALTTFARGSLAAILLAFCLPAQALDLLKPFKGLFADDDVIVWQGPGQFVKIVDQDRIRKDRRPPKNSHPADLAPNQIAAVLASLKLDSGTAVLTSQEVTLLAEKLADGLHRANELQDVVFAIAGGQDAAGRQTTSARMFVEGGRLNIIFGDVHAPADGDAGNTSHFTEPHRAGKRKERVDRDAVIAKGPGISFEVMNERDRRDWVRIDTAAAIAAYRGPMLVAPAAVAAPTPIAAPVVPPTPQSATPTATAVTTPPAGATAPPITAEQQKQLEERRQMAEEMARLRKQVQDQGGAAPAAAGTASAAAKPAGKSIEERMAQLRSLHEKKLITDEEYAAKRKALLEEL